MTGFSQTPDPSTSGITFEVTDENGQFVGSWSIIPDFTNTTIKLQMTDPDGNVYSATIDVSEQ